jgi:hypothetical protein
MSFNFLDQGFMPEESYSRKLDRRVANDEYPYGYDSMEPGAGHVNQGLIDDRYMCEGERAQLLPWNYNKSPDSPAIPRSASQMGSFPKSEVKGAYQAKGKLKGR